MAKKSYIGFCPTCKYCDLTQGYTFCYSTSFRCTWWNRDVKSDEKICSKFEIDRNRTNDLIEQYDR